MLPAGFLTKIKITAQNKVYRGRFTCPEVQWTGTGDDVLSTFTITAGEIADAAASNLLWTDQDVQRGIQPSVMPPPPRELSLSAGYPDASKYIFDASNADDIVTKLLHEEQLFLSPLIWNLRPGSFEAFWNESDREIYIYSGKIYLPDSHHRHQAIIKAANLWRSAQNDYPAFQESRQFKVELYFLSREDEGNYFFDKNQRPKPTAKSKAYDLTTQDDLSLLAKTVIDKTPALKENVNRVTDRLDTRNAQVMTLSTLREMMKTFSSSESIDSSELYGLATVASEFYGMLINARPELGKVALFERKGIRADFVVDSAVMMHGYAAIMKDFNTDLAKQGPVKARNYWQNRLDYLKDSHVYRCNGWHGDFFDKNNPLWTFVGVVRVSPDGQKKTVLNTGAARGECGRVLRQLLSLDNRPTDLAFLSKR